MEILEVINSGSRELKKNKIRSYRLDSEILLAKILKKRREEILTNLEMKVAPKVVGDFNKLIARRSMNEPIAYILEEKEFWSKKFLVSRDTLIPRPETELLVEKIINIFKNKDIKIMDIGTGTGCILLSILSELKNSSGIGIDISKKALQIAKQNSMMHKLSALWSCFTVEKAAILIILDSYKN